MALALGCTLRELYARLTSAELSEWEAFYALEPFGDVRGDLQAALIAATMANAWRGSSRPYALSDFLLDFERGAKSSPRDQAIKEKLLAFTARVGGEIR